MAATSTETGERRIDAQLKEFGRLFGVSSEYMGRGSILPANDPTEKKLDNILGDQGAILNPGLTVGFYFDWDRYDPPAYSLKDDIDQTPDWVTSFDHNNGEPMVRFSHEDGAETTIRQEYLDLAGDFYGLDLLADQDHVEMFPSDVFPIKVTDPEGDTFIFIAPWMMPEDQ